MRTFYLAIIAIFFATAGFAQTQTVTFTNTGNSTWTAPCGVNSITVEVWGGGGAGGTRSSNGAAGGGGGGGYSKKVITVTPLNTYNLRVGAANANNSNNGDSWFLNNSTVLAHYGTSVNNNSANGGAGGALGIGDIRFTGGTGANGVTGSYGGGGGSSAGTGANGITATNANGATAPAGGGNGGDGRSGSQGNGSNGVTPGAGGGGGLRTSSGTRNGGNGAAGKIVITYNGLRSDYCIPDFDEVEPITSVNFAGISQTSSTSTSNSANPYESFCQTGHVSLGNTYPIQIKGNTDGNYINYVTVFIDWDQDGNLDENGEVFKVGILDHTTGTDSYVLNGNITVPANALPGLTKMRVFKIYASGSYNANKFPTEACNDEDYTYGQAEDYVLEVSGCQQPTGATANSTATTISICTGTEVTLRQTGGTLGVDQSWKWYSGSCGGTLINTNTNVDGSYTFTPAVGTTNYYVRAENGPCGTTGDCKTVQVIVKDAATIAVNTGNKDFQVCKGGTATTYVSFTIGGGATGATVTGLPAGLNGTLTGNVYTISGSTAVAAGFYPYTVTPTGNSPCTNTGIDGTVTVIAAPTGISYTTSVTYCAGSTITDNVPVITGGTPNTYSFNPAIPPAGMNFNTSTGVISGTPTVTQGQITYTVTATNDCGFTSGQVKIAISNGSTVYNVLPAGMQNVCSTAGGLEITLSGSTSGVNYQLLRDGVATGSTVPGTNSAISFGFQTVAGTYTVRTANDCLTNMNGSTTINITPRPNTTFTYNSIYCKSAVNAVPAFSGTPLTGIFSAVPEGLVFANATTGEIDIAASALGDYTLTYTIAAAGGCGDYTYSSGIKIVNAPTTFSVTGGGGYCTGTGGIPVGVSNSEAGINYRLYRGATLVATLPGTGAAFNFPNQTVSGTYTIIAVLGSCETPMDDEAVVTENPLPAAITVSPSASTVCQGVIQPLTASLSPAAVSAITQPFVSAVGNVEVPDTDPLGASKLIKVTGIPADATITNVTVNFNITQNKGKELRINLKGPNGNVLNLANELGSNNNGDFTNTTITSAAAQSIALSNAPYTGTFAPQAEIGVEGATSVLLNRSNVSTLTALYNSAASANGNWILSARDIKNSNGDADIKTWTITFKYNTISGIQSVTWSPVTDLYTDAGATVQYTGNTTATVYVKPSGGNLSYTATSTSSFGCISTATSTVTVNPSPVLTLAANYCSPPAPAGKIRITATASNAAVQANTWTWSNGVSGTNTTTTSFIDVDVAGNYFVSASAANGCQSTRNIKVATELIENGDFEQGNIGFTNDYTYVANTLANGLQPASTYTVSNAPNFNHTNFWGVDHTFANGDGKFLLVNGAGLKTVWKQTVTVIPGNTYYFAGYAVSLNDVDPHASLKFRINNQEQGFTTGTLVDKDRNNLPGNWKRFYGSWTPAAGVTTAIVEIIDQQNSPDGNDFGLDDISFGTLSTFLNLTSAAGTDNQLIGCINTPITPIVYEIGSDGAFPDLTNFPAGLVETWDGRTLTISGTPTQAGTFDFSVKSTGCNSKEKTGKIVVSAASSAGTLPNLISACYNTAGTITAPGPIVGDVVNWQSSADGISWTNIVNNTNTLNYPALSEAAYYRISVQNTTGCKIDTSNKIKVGISNLWTGKTNSDWNTTSNWSNEALPDNTCPSVIVPVVTSSIYPSITAGTVSVANLDVKPGAFLKVDGATLKVSGTITSTNGIDAANGTIAFNGSSTQTIAGTMFKDKNIKNLTIENNLNVTGTSADSIRISGTLGFGSVTGKTFAAGSNNIVLLSSLAGTANVGITTGNTLTGDKFTVERFINTGLAGSNPLVHAKAWQLLAVPTTGTQTIKQAWQENSAPTIDSKPGFGTMLSSPSSAAGNGFDAYSAGAYIKSYIPSTDQWDAGPATSAATIATDRGWMTYVRGDRTSVATPKPTILRTTGSLNNGDKNVTVTANKYEVVGNPYASEIDLRQVVRTHLTNEIYIWDPTLGGILGLGRYRTLTYIAEDDEFHITPTGTVYPDEVSNMIQSGQAFFVKSNGEGPSSVTFSEAAKSGSSRVVSRGGASSLESIALNLSSIQADGSSILLDGTLGLFHDNYNTLADSQDGIKLLNSGENVGFRTGGKYLAVERRKSPLATDTLNVEIASMKVQSYTWEIKTTNMTEPGRSAWLLDNYLNTKTPIALEGTTMVTFAVNATPASAAANRFKIIFSKVAGPLPVTFTGISATRNNDRSIAVRWSVENEINLEKYTVERSADGIHFTGIITADVTQSRNYAKNDLSPLAADNYYRIKATSIGGQVQYSAIVKVAPLQQPASISVYPNPVEDKKMNISFVNQKPGEYNLQLINDIGQLMYSGSVKVTSINDRKQVSLGTVKAAGRYTLKVTAEDGSISSVKLLVQ